MSIFISEDVKKELLNIKPGRSMLLSYPLYHALREQFDLVRDDKKSTGIVETLGRGFGKTTALVALSLSTDTPIVYGYMYERKKLDKIANHYFHRDVKTIRLIPGRMNGISCHIVLKDEDTDVEEIRNILGEDIKIVGIDSAI